MRASCIQKEITTFATRCLIPGLCRNKTHTMSLVAVQKEKIAKNGDSLLHVDINDDKVAVSSENGTVSILNLNSELSLIAKTTLKSSQECASICFHKITNYLFCSSGSCVHLLDLRNFDEPVKTFSFNTDEINQITLSPCNKFLLSADDSGEIKVINIETESEEKTLKKHANVCYTLKSRNGEFSEVVSGGYDCHLIRWDLENCKMLQKFDLNEFKTEFSLLPGMNPPYVLDLGFNNSGSLLAAGLQDGSVRLWNTRKRKMKYFDAINAHTSLGVTQVAFIQDEGLVSGGNDEKIKVWKIKCGKHEENITVDHGFKINSLCVNSKDCLLVCDTSPSLSLYRLKS